MYQNHRASSRPESLSLHTVDLSSLQAELEEVSFSSDEDALEAVKCSQQQLHDVARERAEAQLLKNPHNAAALYVMGLEAESRQDWAEAARFSLVGMGKNSVDIGFETGFLTNVDMIRSVRQRWEGGRAPDKWDDVLSFKPRTARAVAAQALRPRWWRLGPLYEALLQARAAARPKLLPDSP